MTLVCYSRCGTCRKARVWLAERGAAFDARDIKENTPTEAELRRWAALAGLSARKLFNTSGLAYRAAGLKDAVGDMTDDEMFAVLSGDGMLVRRPILIGDSFALFGFKEDKWAETLGGRGL
ncbi:MAG: arsenate reductase family protein [Clostridiales bacterium]|jgi:arsenate reductase|nr:arsenate reductase family protein [Clostridiales bacterium]